jgi:hypothetical protein
MERKNDNDLDELYEWAENDGVSTEVGIYYLMLIQIELLYRLLDKKIYVTDKIKQDNL